MTDTAPGPALGEPRLSLPLCILLTAVLALTGCGEPRPYKETRFMMGTLVEVSVYAPEKAAVQAVSRAFDRMAQLERVAHAGHEDSPLARLRRGEAVVLEGDLARILEAGMAVARASSGAFDPAMGELVDLWGLSMDRPRRPSDGEIGEALARKAGLALPSGACCPGGAPVWMDLGGVAKGYAVDMAVELLVDAGVASGVVNAGGDLRTFGRRPGRGIWKIGIQDPDSPQELAGVLQVGQLSVATSGDYQRYFEEDGVRYHHILDPATGYPARSGLRSVTVLAPDCVTADALATAVFVLGAEKGMKLLEGWPGAEGVLIKEDGTVLLTGGIGDGIRFERAGKGIRDQG
ncbi:MAG: FAD:protein FMN transferase [bacterium]|nr:MAG: FAD:protein FMN transferase [bacterium]